MASRRVYRIKFKMNFLFLLQLLLHQIDTHTHQAMGEDILNSNKKIGFFLFTHKHLWRIRYLYCVIWLFACSGINKEKHICDPELVSTLDYPVGNFVFFLIAIFEWNFFFFSSIHFDLLVVVSCFGLFFLNIEKSFCLNQKKIWILVDFFQKENEKLKFLFRYFFNYTNRPQSFSNLMLFKNIASFNIFGINFFFLFFQFSSLGLHSLFNVMITNHYGCLSWSFCLLFVCSFRFHFHFFQCKIAIILVLISCFFRPFRWWW